MKSLRYLFFFLLILFALLISGCGVNPITADPTPALFAPPVEGENSAPPLETSVEEIIIEKNTPTGVCVRDEAKEVLDCFDVDSKPLSTVQVPGIGSIDPQGLHLAGPLGTGKTPPPVIYFSWEPDQALLVSKNGVVEPLRKTNSFLAMAGAAGKPVLAFSEMDFENNIPHSYLFAGTLKTLETSVSFFDLKDALTGMALMPVGVEAVGEQPLKIWYTHTAWGIGGEDLVYPINRGLYVFDLATGQNTQVLGSERNFQGLSPDNTQAGSINFNFKEDNSMRVTDLLSGHMVNFPLNPSSNRGAGYAVFSIDGKYAAWLEASGSMITEPPNFQTRVRVGDIAAGTVLQEVDSAMASQVLSWDRISSMRPIGWLNTQTLVIEVHGNAWNTAALIKYDIFSGSLAVICHGSFAGFSYP